MIQPGMVIPHSVGGWTYTIQIDGSVMVFDGNYTSTYDAKTAMREKVSQLKDERKRTAVLECVVKDTFWMARRYANKRRTYAPSVVNDSLAKLESIGVEISDDHTLISDGNSSGKTLDT